MKDGKTALCLTRGWNQSLMIHVGDEVIEVKVVRIKPSEVRLAFFARPEVRIVRAEMEKKN